MSSASPDPAPRPIDWRAAYEQWAPEIARYVRTFVRDDAAAADLVQDCFERAMRSERSLRDATAVRAWLYKIASNAAIEQLRRSRRFAFIPFSGGEQGESDAVDPEIDHVRRALRAIPPDQAIALVLCLQEGFSRREAADLLGIGEEAVKSRLARGRVSFVAAYDHIGGTR
jgi:RNA polymerase sigma-70 factor (ECF subfamily)